jgi:transposase-like protein
MGVYANGVSTRAVDDLVAALGAESGIKKSESPRHSDVSAEPSGAEP